MAGLGPGNWGDNLVGDWCSRLGPAGIWRSLFIRYIVEGARHNDGMVVGHGGGSR